MSNWRKGKILKHCFAENAYDVIMTSLAGYFFENFT